MAIGSEKLILVILDYFCILRRGEQWFNKKILIIILINLYMRYLLKLILFDDGLLILDDNRCLMLELRFLLKMLCLNKLLILRVLVINLIILHHS
jgi:hypothetical protein